MKIPAWVPALVLSAIVHGALVIPTVPELGRTIGTARHLPIDSTAMQMLVGASIAWCVIASIWSAMVTNVLSSPGNRWGGIGGMRLFAVVVGLTLALDLVDSPCMFTCPPLLLVVPILSYVAISNISMPLAPEDKKEEPVAHG